MRTWQVILIILFTATICSAVGYGCGRRKPVPPISADTVVIRDTLRDTVPRVVYETLVQEIPELFPVYVTLDGDTVREDIPVPITQREYRTDSYRAWVSGYRPSLDSVWVYPEKVYIREKARRWGIGVIGGYGIGKDGLSPYVGVGAYYRIW